MHTYEQVIKRIDEIVQMINEIPADRINMDAWVTMHDDSECGSICCVLGWAANKQMFDLHLRTRVRIDAAARPRPFMVPVVGASEEFDAGRHILFGDIKLSVPVDERAHVYALTRRIADGMFEPVGLSIYDDSTVRRPKFGDDQRQVFLNRIPRAKHEVREMYNLLAGEANEFCCWDRVDHVE